MGTDGNCDEVVEEEMRTLDLLGLMLDPAAKDEVLGQVQQRSWFKELGSQSGWLVLVPTDSSGEDTINYSTVEFQDLKDLSKLKVAILTSGKHAALKQGFKFIAAELSLACVLLVLSFVKTIRFVYVPRICAISTFSELSYGLNIKQLFADGLNRHYQIKLPSVEIIK